MARLKTLADIMTLSRGAIAIWVLLISLLEGAAAFPRVAWLVLAAWTTDLLDGPLARLSRLADMTFIGRQDMVFDVALGLATLVFMLCAGMVGSMLGGVYLLGWLGALLFWGPRPVLGTLFQAPIYLVFGLSTLQLAPALGALLIAWLTLNVTCSWPRLRAHSLPRFLRGLRGLRGATEDTERIPARD